MSDFALHQRDNLDLEEDGCQDAPSTGTQGETGTETPGGTGEAFKVSLIDNPEVSLTSDIPPPKRYAHHGKRRRCYTEELFRCSFTDMVSRTPLVCNHLLWKNRPQELREHLLDHMNVEDVSKLTDSEVCERYQVAKRIFLQGIPEDTMDGDEDDYEGEEDFE